MAPGPLCPPSPPPAQVAQNGRPRRLGHSAAGDPGEGARPHFQIGPRPPPHPVTHGPAAILAAATFAGRPGPRGSESAEGQEEPATPFLAGSVHTPQTPKLGQRVWALIKPLPPRRRARQEARPMQRPPARPAPVLTPWLKPSGVAAAEPGAAAAAAKANAAAGTAASNTPWRLRALREGRREGPAQLQFYMYHRTGQKWPRAAPAGPL